jgi:hypothetical protein
MEKWLKYLLIGLYIYFLYLAMLNLILFWLFILITIILIILFATKFLFIDKKSIREEVQKLKVKSDPLYSKFKEKPFHKKFAIIFTAILTIPNLMFTLIFTSGSDIGLASLVLMAIGIFTGYTLSFLLVAIPVGLIFRREIEHDIPIAFIVVFILSILLNYYIGILIGKIIEKIRNKLKK